MKVALSLEVTDDQRRQLACRIAGKSVARLATREEVRQFVDGALGSLALQPNGLRVDDSGIDYGEDRTHSDKECGDVDVAQARRLGVRDADEQATADKLLAEGKSESYIRGWLAAGRHSR